VRVAARDDIRLDRSDEIGRLRRVPIDVEPDVRDVNPGKLRRPRDAMGVKELQTLEDESPPAMFNLDFPRTTGTGEWRPATGPCVRGT
jgi:hypothetical protein